MKYEIEKRVKEIARGMAGTILAVAVWSSIIGGCSTVLYREEVDNRACQKLINKVRQVAAGEDQVIDRQEKSKLLRELNITNAIDESETLTFTRQGANKINVWARATGYDRHSYYLGTISQTNLQNYVGNHAEAIK